MNVTGTDPKSVLCAFFKSGSCGKGAKCKFSHDLDIERKTEKRNLYEDVRDDKGMTVKPHLSRSHLSRFFTYPDICMGADHNYIYRKWLTYPEIRLFGRSGWERRCPNK